MSPALSGGFFTTDPPEKPRVAEQFFSGKQRRLIGKERHVENDRMCACWGDTAIFNRMVRQWFTDKMTFEPLPKGREVLSCRKEEHSKWRKQQRFQNGNTEWAWRASRMSCDWSYDTALVPPITFITAWCAAGFPVDSSIAHTPRSRAEHMWYVVGTVGGACFRGETTGSPQRRALMGDCLQLRQLHGATSFSRLVRLIRAGEKGLYAMPTVGPLWRTSQVPDLSVGLAEAFLRTTSVFRFSFCAVLLPSSPFHRCGFQEHLFDMLSVSYSPWGHKESDMTEQPTHIQAAKPGASQAAQWVKNPPALQETQEAWVQSLGQEHLPEEGMATHSSSLAWRIPRTEEPGWLRYRGSPRVRHDWSGWTHTHSAKLCLIVCFQGDSTWGDSGVAPRKQMLQWDVEPPADR